MNMGNHIYHLLRVHMELAGSIGGTRSIGGSGDDIDAGISVTLCAEYEIARETLFTI